MKRLQIACLLTFITTSIQGATLLSNLSPNTLASGNIDNVEQRAVTFRTEAIELFVTEVQFSLQYYTSETDIALMSIHADGGTHPDSQIGANFTAPASSSEATAVFSFTSPGITLAADTTYWIVIKSQTSSAFSWHRSNPTQTPTPTVYAAFEEQWISQNTGGTWAIGGSGAHSFAIVGIPEPQTATLLGMTALFGFLFSRQGRKNPQT